MTRTWKWIKLFCPACGAEQVPAVGPVKGVDSLVSPYPCWDCEHPEEVERRRLAQAESDHKLRGMCERGEVKDADGNVLSYFVVVT